MLHRNLILLLAFSACQTFAVATINAQTSKHDSNIGSLRRTITATLDPASWSETGGPGTIHVVQGMLVISQTRDVHRDIDDLLRLLRKARELHGPLPHIQVPEQTSVVFQDEEHAAARKKIEQQLATKTKIAAGGRPLNEVIAAVFRAHPGISFYIDKRRLEEVGLDERVKLRQDLDASTLELALTRALDDLDLAFVVRDDYLMITTVEEAACWFETRVYPVADFDQSLIPVHP